MGAGQVHIRTPSPTGPGVQTSAVQMRGCAPEILLRVPQAACGQPRLGQSVGSWFFKCVQMFCLHIQTPLDPNLSNPTDVH